MKNYSQRHLYYFSVNQHRLHTNLGGWSDRSVERPEELPYGVSGGLRFGLFSGVQGLMNMTDWVTGGYHSKFLNSSHNNILIGWASSSAG